jgi:hypothetical protein
MFSPFNWLSTFTCIALQMALFYKLRKPKSLKYLMLFLTSLNVALMIVRNHPFVYWDVVWTGRMIAMCWFIWAVGDICFNGEGVPWWWRIPVFGNVLVFFWYEPYSPWTTVGQLEIFLGLGFLVALFMVVLRLIFVGLNSPSFHSQAGLGSFLAFESSAALLEISRPHSVWPLISSMVGLVCWVSILVLPDGSNGARNLAPAPPLLPRDY